MVCDAKKVIGGGKCRGQWTSLRKSKETDWQEDGRVLTAMRSGGARDCLPRILGGIACGELAIGN